MKRHILIITGALLFSTLFYSQGLGLNMLIFAMVSISLIFMLRPSSILRRDLVITATAYLISSIFVFTVNSGLAIGINIIAFLVFVGSISGFDNSIYVQWFNGVYQTFIGALHERMQGNPSKKKVQKKQSYGFVILTTSIVVICVALFASLYREANPILGNWLAQIDLSFINFSWILTSLMGYFLLLNITATAELDVMTTIDREASTLLIPRPIEDQKKLLLSKEITLGTTLLVALNSLIILFIVTDGLYLLSNPLSDAVTLSKTVHEGVYALILSIIFAISIILILFRGDLNFYKKSTHLRTLTYIWIACNIIIIVLTAYKNYVYSSGFGLTYKRIGVGIYLAICISGMVTLSYKIARKHNFLFMIQANARVVFFVLVAASSFHWDRTITSYNLSQIPNPDMNYLLNELDDHGDLLYAFAKAHPEKAMNPDRINKQYEQWQAVLSNQTWQSKTLLGMLNPQTKNYEITEVNRKSYQ